MPLTDLQKRQLITKCNSININTLMGFIQSGDISLNELPSLSADRRQYIEDQINSMPNPQEQREWLAIDQQKSVPSRPLLDEIARYIRRWEGTRPSGNHVDEANSLYTHIESVIREKERAEEESDWNKVDPFDKSSLLGHLSKYPNTVHRDEIDESYWSLINQEEVSELNDYVSSFPCGKHVTDAKRILGSIVEWSNVKNTYDLEKIYKYVEDNPKTPFMKQAQLLIMELKQEEINSMRTHPNSYNERRLLKFLELGVFKDSELIQAGVMTTKVLQLLTNEKILNGLPDINSAIQSSTAVCKSGSTDVFFFGIPSTGKTCVLMGLSCSPSLHVELASGGGNYAAALQSYTNVGKAVPRTPGDFVTTLEATIRSKSNPDVEHNINLVEMSGEDFSFRIANNPEQIFTFENMASGVTDLLKNNNPKVFFIIIDPTANDVTVSREFDRINPLTREKETNLEYCSVNQRILLDKLVGIFKKKSNADIMKKVNAIHVILTKSDTLGNNPVERDDVALRIFRDQYEQYILQPLIDVCSQGDNNINLATKHHPKLYTFSLGKFYVGGHYEYNPTDSDRLVKAILNSTSGIKKPTWWDRIKEKVN